MAFLFNRLKSDFNYPRKFRALDIPFCERHAATVSIGDPLGHPKQRKSMLEEE